MTETPDLAQYRWGWDQWMTGCLACDSSSDRTPYPMTASDEWSSDYTRSIQSMEEPVMDNITGPPATQSWLERKDWIKGG